VRLALKGGKIEGNMCRSIIDIGGKYTFTISLKLALKGLGG
jgi:hypothetical protein